MADNPATTADIESRWRPLTEAEDIVAATLLDDGWAILLDADPSIETRLDADPPELDERKVQIVLFSMAVRVLRNPDGIRQESIDDYAFTRDSGGASGLLQVTDEELEFLAAAESASTAFTIRPAHQVPVNAAKVDPDSVRWSP